MARNPAHPNRSHRYVRIDVKGRSSVTNHRWRCILPGCHHYLLEDFIVGAVAECHRCEKDFVIDKKTAIKKPHCRQCTRRKEPAEIEITTIPESPI